MWLELEVRNAPTLFNRGFDAHDFCCGIRAALRPFCEIVAAGSGLAFLYSLGLGAVRLATIFFLRESSEPAMGFVVAPFIWSLYAAIARGIKLVIFRIPALQRSEEAVRIKLAAMWKHRKGVSH
jgi:hypothetical protein